MITFTKKQINLVFQMGTLEELVTLQTGLLRLLARQPEQDQIGQEYVHSIATLLEATLFSVDQLAKIETLFQRAAPAAPLSEAA